MEFFHEKNGHSKKLRKNKRNLSPLYFFEKNKITKLKESEQKIVGKRGESGRIVEYFIKYQNKNLVYELKTNFLYGDILRDTKFFTNKNFKDLYEKMIDISHSSKKVKTVESRKSRKSICEINDERTQINEEEKEEKIGFDEKFDDQKLESYEKRYLLKGKYFVYPDSIPFIYPSNDGNYIIPFGLKLYLEKYEKNIEEGKKMHYSNDGFNIMKKH